MKNMFDKAKLVALRARLDDAMRSALTERDRVTNSSSTTEEARQAHQKLEDAKNNVNRFLTLCVLGRLLDEQGDGSLIESTERQELLASGRDPDILNYKPYPDVTHYAVSTLAGKPREVYINIGSAAAHANWNFSFVFLWESEGGAVGIQRMTRYADVHMVAAAQQPQWPDPSAARNKVAAELLHHTHPEYGFCMRGLPIRLPDTLPEGYSDWTQWVARRVDYFLRSQNLISDGFLILGTEEQTAKVLMAASQLMLPNWWEKKFD